MTPDEITVFSLTITDPTDGFKPVLPRFFLPIEKLNLNNDYDLLSSKLPINCSKSFASLKFLYTEAKRT